MNAVGPHTPIQYIIGRTRFRGLDVRVDERVLIPRPETEVLVETAEELIGRSCRRGAAFSILDLCTGSGNIAIALACGMAAHPALPGIYPEPVEGLTKKARECTIVASDISQEALGLARLNAVMNGVAGRIDFVASDLFSAIGGRFDIIVSNPPYIARHEFATLQPEVLQEPRIALDGGDDGLDYYRKILAGSMLHLKHGGCLAMEIGYGQLARIGGIVERTGSMELVDVRPDHSGIERVVVVKWKN